MQILGGLALKHAAWGWGWKRCIPPAPATVEGDVGAGEEERRKNPLGFYLLSSLLLVHLCDRMALHPHRLLALLLIQQDFRSEELCDSLPGTSQTPRPWDSAKGMAPASPLMQGPNPLQEKTKSFPFFFLIFIFFPDCLCCAGAEAALQSQGDEGKAKSGP